jgi:hypothetical protein
MAAPVMSFLKSANLIVSRLARSMAIRSPLAEVTARLYVTRSLSQGIANRE